MSSQARAFFFDVSVSRWRALRPAPGNLCRLFALVAETAAPTPVDHDRDTTQEYERDHEIQPEHHRLLSEPSPACALPVAIMWCGLTCRAAGACRHRAPLPDHRSDGVVYDLRRRRTSRFKRRPESRHTRDESDGVETMWKSCGDSVKIMALALLISTTSVVVKSF